jgi:hypothetical protein
VRNYENDSITKTFEGSGLVVAVGVAVTLCSRTRLKDTRHGKPLFLETLVALND